MGIVELPGDDILHLYDNAATARLVQRVKELACLCAASDVLRRDETAISDLFVRAVSVIPSGWRFPDLAEARLTVEGAEYATPGFRRTGWCLLASVRFGPEEPGTLVAHDFNNLLTVIKGRAQLGVEDLEESDPFREDVLEILEAADRAQDLTRQLLTFSRHHVAAPRVVEAAEVLGPAEKMLQRLIGEDVTLTVTAAPELGPVRVDPTQLDQVLMTLAINARDAMPGGGRLTIHAEKPDAPEPPPDGQADPRRPGRYVRFQFTDTGTGMDPETKRKIFEPFFTTKPHVRSLPAAHRRGARARVHAPRRLPGRRRVRDHSGRGGRRGRSLRPPPLTRACRLPRLRRRGWQRSPMSGYTEDEVLQRSKLDPGIERLEKPFAAGELQQKIRQVLEPRAHDS